MNKETEKQQSSKRIYLVSEQNDGGRYLVRATSQASAIRHVTADLFKAEVAKQEELVSLVAEGFRVEDAA